MENLTPDQLRKLKPHPVAEWFPMIDDDAEAYDDFRNDIAQNGVINPIIVDDQYVFDGRNRRQVCLDLNISCPARKIDDRNPIPFIISMNLKRRHLTPNQRSLIAAKWANVGEGRPRKDASPEAVSQGDAAKSLGVGRASVQRAKVVIDEGVPELEVAVDRGEIGLEEAATIARKPKGEQTSILAKDKADRKKAVRQERERVLAEKIRNLPNKKYGVILADPEWRFEPYSRETGMDRAADNHYPTSVTEDIAKRDVPSISADDCVLFLWATVPMLPDALIVMERWGFKYKSHFIWLKNKIGTGYWSRNKHELLLIGTRGDIPAPSMGTQSESVIYANLRGHSQKPDEFLEIIEDYFPNLPKIELNRRGPAREGWDAWGNEADEEWENNEPLGQ